MIRDGLDGRFDQFAATARRALEPADPTWLRNRLSGMCLAMTSNWDEAKATAWLHETQRLLADLPSDILSDAIDAAIKSSARGFMPSVGEIRAIADPRMADRKRTADRLAAVAALPAGTEKRRYPWEIEPFNPADACPPEVAAQILDSMNLRADRQSAPKRTHDGPPRVPTAAEIAEMVREFTAAESGPAEPLYFDPKGLNLTEILARRRMVLNGDIAGLERLEEARRKPPEPESEMTDEQMFAGVAY